MKPFCCQQENHTVKLPAISYIPHAQLKSSSAHTYQQVQLVMTQKNNVLEQLSQSLDCNETHMLWYGPKRAVVVKKTQRDNILLQGCRTSY